MGRRDYAGRPAGVVPARKNYIIAPAVKRFL
jgi:hypothetical protein